MKENILILLFIFVSITNSYLLAQQEPLSSDRPDQTDSPFLVPFRYLQIESGISYEKSDNGSSALTHPDIIWRYGVSDKLELRLFTQLATLTENGVTETGVNPVGVSLKLALFEERGMLPTVGFLGNVTLPFLATKNFKATDPTAAFVFLFENTLSKHVSVSYNLGVEWDGGGSNSDFIYSVSGAHSIDKNLSAFTELYGTLQPEQNPMHLADFGIAY
ncbi:hypothetical protein BH10BAC5_BH10BAC5_18300 [soil metagenome]